MSETLTIGSGALTVTVARRGAELQSIVDGDGRDLLWNGDPAWWTGRAPLLFPIVGALAGGTYRLDGEAYRLPKHGFARVSDFETRRHDAMAVTLGLRDSAETRAQYPFAFDLAVTYAVEGDRLTLSSTIGNPGDTPLPASFGYHPALRWPLPYGGGRDDHRLIFDTDPGPLHRIDTHGLLKPDALPSPVADRVLTPRDSLFEDDALIFTAPAARHAWFGVSGRPGVALEWNLSMLGVWTKPGAPFLCIEPWAGVADPVGYAGEFRDKQGIVEVMRGAPLTATLSMRFGVEAG